MATPPNLPPVVQSDTLFSYSPLHTLPPELDFQFTPVLSTNPATTVPPFAPTPPPPTTARTIGSPPPRMPDDVEHRPVPSGRDSDPAQRSRRRSGSGSRRSESRTSSRSSEESGEGEDDSDREEAEDPRYHWRPLVEDTSEACEDEIAFVQAKGEHSALDSRYWEEQAFFDLDDDELVEDESGTIDWVIERFNGTKEEPNKDHVMRSPIMRIGNHDWRIVFYPKGNTGASDYLSVYLECVTLQAPEYEEFETFTSPAFPLLRGEEASGVKKRRSIAAQLAVIMYNPGEPRTYMHNVDAHRFSKASPDYGWKYFAQRDEFLSRKHGQRQALLRGDKIAFRAHIRVINDPTGCMWSHERINGFKDSLQSTSLRPFSGQAAHLAALLPLLHFFKFRELIRSHQKFTRTVYKLQTLLWKMFPRTHSDNYGRRPDSTETTDAVSCVRAIAEQVGHECGEARVEELLGTLDPKKGAAIGSNRLSTKNHKSVQEAVSSHPTAIATPAFLVLELQRQEFDAKKRKWKKPEGRIQVDTYLNVGDTQYQLFAFVTHCGDLQSNKHNAYVKPAVTGGNWYVYRDGRVTAMTHKQAVVTHEGGTSLRPSSKDSRRDSPFSDFLDMLDSELVYMVMYIRADHRALQCTPQHEDWNVPEEIRQNRAFPRHKEALLPPKDREEASNLSSDAAQEPSEEEREIAAGASTPEWPLTDDEGDTIMSDADDDTQSREQLPDIPDNTLTASVTLTQISTKPCRSQKWTTTIDALGRDWYRGEMFGDKYQGQGHLITMSGDQYIGAFSQGKQEGHGKIIYAATGNVYEGEWKDNQHHGHGKLTEAATGNIFEGGWKEGKKHGQFVLKGQVTEEERGLCTICYEQEMTTAFYDCGHVLACKECAGRIDHCPICRRRVVGRLQLYGV